MISGEKINKNNINDLLGVVIKYVVVQFLQKNLCFDRNLLFCFVAFISPDLAWCWWHIIKQTFHAFFCLILKLFTLGNIMFTYELTGVNNF